MNTRILHVFGEDYSASGYERLAKDDKIVPEQLWEKSWESASKLEYEDDENMFSYRAYRFGDIDPRFIEFVQSNVQDYEDSKSNNFYVIGE